MPRESGRKVVATNRKARHDYHIMDTYEAGMALMGTEVKSLREGRASLVDGFAIFYNNELYLESVYIPEYLNGSWTNHAARQAADPARTAGQPRGAAGDAGKEQGSLTGPLP